MKERSKALRTSGVYKILCSATGAVYVGSSVDIQNRWRHHRCSLRRGDHPNLRLQRAWNAFGAESFEFAVLEHASVDDLLAVEQRWIDALDAADPAKGFNVFDTAGSPGGAFARTWEGFVDPEGNPVTITNLFEFCRLHDLDFPSMHRLSKGKSKLKSYKGWTHVNSVRKRDFVKVHVGFVAPDGTPHPPITNLAAFCRERGLDTAHMVAVAHGRIRSHRGWTHVDHPGPRQLNSYRFLSPSGEPVLITNLREFCVTHGLGVGHMYAVMGGRRKSHKGWTWRSTDA